MRKKILKNWCCPQPKHTMSLSGNGVFHPPLKCGIMQSTLKKLIFSMSTPAPGFPHRVPYKKKVEGVPLSHKDIIFLPAEFHMYILTKCKAKPLNQQTYTGSK